MRITGVDWNRAVAATALRLKAEFKAVGTPESVGVPIAVRAITMLGQELGMIPRGVVVTDFLTEGADDKPVS